MYVTTLMVIQYLCNYRYHKFLRSKDLSRKANEDINCVFGKRKRKRESDKQVCSFFLLCSAVRHTRTFMIYKHVIAYYW